MHICILSHKAIGYSVIVVYLVTLVCICMGRLITCLLITGNLAVKVHLTEPEKLVITWANEVISDDRWNSEGEEEWRISGTSDKSRSSSLKLKAGKQIMPKNNFLALSTYSPWLLHA